MTAADTRVHPARPELRTSRTPSWLRDLLLGVRLAVGGGRTSWSRLALGTIGIGLAVGILLIGASVPAIMARHAARTNANDPVYHPRAGVSALYYADNGTEFRGTYISGAYVYPTGANSPVPPGIPHNPGPGEIFLSPALADLLNSADGALLRQRFPERVAGIIGMAGLSQPTQLNFIAGADAQLAGAENTTEVYAFGGPGLSRQLSPLLLALVVVGVVVLLIPIMIFVGVSSRIAGAQRDRRLAALRLVGAGSRQTRRIAAAESLVGAATGLVLGVLLFLLAKQAAGGVELLGESTFSSDMAPSWWLIVLVVLLVPVIAVGSSLLAMRRTVIEPLGVVRESRPVRRRVWWRLAVLVLGVVLLVLPKHGTGTDTVLELAAGASALLIAVPALLPWLLERCVSVFGGGRPSWQLAVRRLQLDSGTPARVVAGVAVVVAGAIALQTVLLAAYNKYGVEQSSLAQQYGVSGQSAVIDVTATPDIADRVAAVLPGVQGVRAVYPYRYIDVEVPIHTPYERPGQPNTDEVTVASCAVIEVWFQITDCADGAVFRTGSSSGSSEITPGMRLPVVHWDYSNEHATAQIVGNWTVPQQITTLPRNAPAQEISGLVVTPGALGGAVPVTDEQARYDVRVGQADADAVEYVRNALAGFTWKTYAYPRYTLSSMSTDQQTLATIRIGLLIGSMFTLLLAGASLLVLALEQIRERRRPLAALAAAGVPRSMLGRSLLWQTTIPVVVGVAVASVIGLGLAWLVLWRMSPTTTMTIDWADIGIFAGAAIALVLAVTALTLPALRGATKLAALRSE